MLLGGKVDHAPDCGCAAVATRRVDRRWLLRAASAGALLAAVPGMALAAGGYKAMILACIDPRVQGPVHAYAAAHGLAGQYSQFVIAGAAIGVVSPKFAGWHEAFWDNLAVSIDLHRIKKVIAIDHRDCGAAKIAYGADKLKTRDDETSVHRMALADFRKQCSERHPKLAVENGLMSLRGRIERLG